MWPACVSPAFKAAVIPSAMIGAAMMVQGIWSGEGVFNMEEMDPDPFMDMLNKHGLPWQVAELDGPVQF